MKWTFNERTFLCLARRQEDGAEENKNLDFSILKQTKKCRAPVLVNCHLKCTGHFTLVSVNLTMLKPLGHDVFNLVVFGKM